MTTTHDDGRMTTTTAEDDRRRPKTIEEDRRRPKTAGDDLRPLTDGRWTTVAGRLTMGNGRETADDGRRSMTTEGEPGRQRACAKFGAGTRPERSPKRATVRSHASRAPLESPSPVSGRPPMRSQGVGRGRLRARPATWRARAGGRRGRRSSSIAVIRSSVRPSLIRRR